MIDVIRNDQRYHFESDWLSTFWHFSFDHYYDPNNMSFGPLRVFNDDVVQPSSGFPMHSHREMEIITYVLEGELEHKDNTGAADRIGPGEVQRMSAGTGIRHSEYNPSTEHSVHLLQMWITPSMDGLPPSYEQLRFTREQRTGKLLPVASGQGVSNTVKVHQDTTLYVSLLDTGDEVQQVLATDRRAYIFLISGKLDLNVQELAGGDQAKIIEESTIRLKAKEPSELVLFDLP
jgi:redox-sensitive bicupin YhaK (pirin superfamily)